jgi:hypothetical protein
VVWVHRDWLVPGTLHEPVCEMFLLRMMPVLEADVYIEERLENVILSDDGVFETCAGSTGYLPVCESSNFEFVMHVHIAARY